MKKHLIFFFIFIGLVILVLGNTSFAARNFSETEYKFSPFSTEGANITLLYPEGWSIKESNLEKGIVIATESPDSFLFDIYRDKKRPDQTLADYAEIQYEWLKKKRENFKELYVKENMKIGDFSGILRRYSYTYKDNGYEAQEFYFNGGDGYFYLVLLDTPQGEFDENLFEKLVSGLKIDNSVENLPTNRKKTEIEMKKFISSNSDFVLEYPNDWTLYPPKEDVSFSATDGKGTFVEVLTHNIPKTMSTKEYALSSGKWLAEKLKDYNQTDFKPYEKDDLKGYMRSYNYTVNGKKHYALEYYFTYKLEDISKGFTLIFDMPYGFDSKYLEILRDIQKKMLNSFSLIYG